VAFHGFLGPVQASFIPLFAAGLIWVNASAGAHRFNGGRVCRTTQEPNMKAIVDLFSTDYGLMSAGVIAFVIVMGVWFYRFFARKIAESEQAARKS
jgi:heme/copper-type cytochrome/quinol oxidase subunit 2